MTRPCDGDAADASAASSSAASTVSTSSAASSSSASTSADNGDAGDAPDIFRWLSREVRELAGSHVPRHQGAPSSLVFLRQHVASNRPVRPDALKPEPVVDPNT